MEKLYTESETGCCPRFDPKPWDKRTVIMKDKLFLKAHVISLFHIPLNFGSVITKKMEKVKAANALSKKPFMLSDENSMWGSDMYIAVDKEVPGEDMVKISGTFLTKVYEGAYKDISKWIANMGEYISSKNKTCQKMYFFYTTCPACAKYYGKNYVVLLAKIK